MIDVIVTDVIACNCVFVNAARLGCAVGNGERFTGLISENESSMLDANAVKEKLFSIKIDLFY